MIWYTPQGRVYHFKYLGEIIEPTGIKEQAQRTRILKVQITTSNSTKHLLQKEIYVKNIKSDIQNRNRING